MENHASTKSILEVKNGQQKTLFCYIGDLSDCLYSRVDRRFRANNDNNATMNATQNATTNATMNATQKVTTGAVASVASAAASAAGGFLGLPGFEALYAVVGLLVVAYLVIQRRK